MEAKLSRRKLIKTASVFAVGLSAGLTSCVKEKKTVSPNEKIHLGIIGTGDRGYNQIMQALQHLPEIEIVACCDVLDDHLTRALNLAGVKCTGYTDYRKMLENKDIDVVAVVTPLHLHYQMAMDALDAGFHVVCEKTMTYDIQQALSLKKKANESKSLFKVSYEIRNNPMYGKVKELVEEGLIGKVTHASCIWNRNSDWRREVNDPSLERLINWRLYQEYSGGLMAELTSHQLDLVQWMLDTKPTMVQGTGGINYWHDGRDTYDHIQATFTCANQIMIGCTSLLSNANEGYAINIYGDKGTIKIDWENAWVYPEKVADKADLKSIDAVTGASTHWFTEPDKRKIEVENEERKYFSKHVSGYVLDTLIGYRKFAKQIVQGTKPEIDADAGADSSIAVYLANQAIYNNEPQVFNVYT